MVFFFTVSSCAPFYHFRPLAHIDPQKMPIVQSLPQSGLSIGIKTYHTAQDIHDLFGHHGLWREHVIPIQIVLKETDPRYSATIAEHSIFLSLLGQNYRSISPSEAFDISWQANVPYVNIKQTLYYTGVFLFTLVTLGLGSFIWILPSPFAQPNPQATPFGRDLSYKALPLHSTIYPNENVGGLLYFNLPFNEQLLSRTILLFQIRETAIDKKSPPRVIDISIPLTSHRKSDVNPVMEILHGFF